MKKRVAILALVIAIFTISVLLYGIGNQAFAGDDEAMAEVDITSGIIASGQNGAGLTFLADKRSSTLQYMTAKNMAWADGLVNAPKGSTRILTGEANQIAGNSGFFFTIPLSNSGNAKGITGVEATFPLMPSNIGKTVYDAMAAEIKTLKDQHYAAEGGLVFFVPNDPTFLKNHGISIMARFENGETLDVTTTFSYGILVNDIDSGSMPINFGTIFMDSNPIGGKLFEAQQITGEVANTFFDGKRDGNISGAFWLTTEKEEEGIAEVEITDKVITASNNAAGVEFLAATGSVANQFASQLGIEWIDKMMSSPLGKTTLITGQAGQLAGKTGYSFSLPSNQTGSTKKAAVITETPLEITSSAFGSAAYEALLADLSASSNKMTLEDGTVISGLNEPTLLKKHGISIMFRFGDGATKDVTSAVQSAFMTNGASGGSMTMIVGAVFIDSDPVNGSYWIQPDLGGGEKAYIVYDGAGDKKIAGELWITKASKNNGGSSGCNTGIPAMLVFAVLISMSWARKY